MKVLVAQCPNSLLPHGPARLCSWVSPGKNTGGGSPFLLQGIFPTQVTNLGLLYYRQILHHLSHHMPIQIKKIFFYFKVSLQALVFLETCFGQALTPFAVLLCTSVAPCVGFLFLCFLFDVRSVFPSACLPPGGCGHFLRPHRRSVCTSNTKAERTVGRSARVWLVNEIRSER